MSENKKNKTVLMVMLIMALSSAIFISPVAAQVTVSIENASASKNATTITQIIAHDVTDLGVFGLSLEYDPDVVIAISAENNPDLPDVWGVSDFSKNETGYVGIASSQLPPYPSLSGDVVLCTTVTLKAVGEPGEISTLNITIGTLYKSDGITPIEAVDVDGNFTIIATAKTGDMDSSGGEPDLDDVILLARHVLISKTEYPLYPGDP